MKEINLTEKKSLEDKRVPDPQGTKRSREVVKLPSPQNIPNSSLLTLVLERLQNKAQEAPSSATWTSAGSQDVLRQRLAEADVYTSARDNFQGFIDKFNGPGLSSKGEAVATWKKWQNNLKISSETNPDKMYSTVIAETIDEVINSQQIQQSAREDGEGAELRLPENIPDNHVLKKTVEHLQRKVKDIQSTVEGISTLNTIQQGPDQEKVYNNAIDQLKNFIGMSDSPNSTMQDRTVARWLQWKENVQTSDESDLAKRGIIKIAEALNAIPETILVQKGYQRLANSVKPRDLGIEEQWKRVGEQTKKLTTDDTDRYIQQKAEEVFRDHIRKNLEKHDKQDEGRKALEAWLQGEQLPQGYQVQFVWERSLPQQKSIYYAKFVPTPESNISDKKIIYALNDSTSVGDYLNTPAPYFRQLKLKDYNKSFKTFSDKEKNNKNGELKTLKSDNNVLPSSLEIRFDIQPGKYYIYLNRKTKTFYISNSENKIASGLQKIRIKKGIQENDQWKLYSTTEAEVNAPVQHGDLKRMSSPKWKEQIIDLEISPTSFTKEIELAEGGEASPQEQQMVNNWDLLGGNPYAVSDVALNQFTNYDEGSNALTDSFWNAPTEVPYLYSGVHQQNFRNPLDNTLQEFSQEVPTSLLQAYTPENFMLGQQIDQSNILIQQYEKDPLEPIFWQQEITDSYASFYPEATLYQPADKSGYNVPTKPFLHYEYPNTFQKDSLSLPVDHSEAIPQQQGASELSESLIDQNITSFTNIFQRICTQNATEADIDSQIIDLMNRQQYRSTKAKFLSLGHHFMEKKEDIARISIYVKHIAMRAKNPSIPRLSLEDENKFTDKEEELARLMLTFTIKNEKYELRAKASGYISAYTKHSAERNAICHKNDKISKEE